MGTSLLFMGNPTLGQHHLNSALALYDAAEHRALASRFGQDARVAALSYRSWAQWMLGYPDSALMDAERALEDARDTNQAAELMHTLFFKSFCSILCGNYTAAKMASRELASLADEKDSAFFRTSEMIVEGLIMACTGKAENAIRFLNGAITASRAIGTTMFLPVYWSYLARANAELGRLETAWSYIGEAMSAVDATKETWWQSEVHRAAGEIALKSPQTDLTKAEVYFERSLAVARQQQAKSWELRAAMSMARLWREQGKRDEARELLAPVYGWFTEGFDTRDLREAKALLDELS
jgi:predicted ATPase